MKRERCVLFQWISSELKEDSSGTLIEQLRYAGVLNIVKETLVDDKTIYMLELKAPKRS